MVNTLDGSKRFQVGIQLGLRKVKMRIVGVMFNTLITEMHLGWT